jgi:hypothetical protein
MAAIMPVGPAPAIKTGFTFSFIVVSLLSKPVFEMFHTLESQLFETKPCPHDYSSEQMRHPVMQYGCHPPGAHSCRKSLKANTCSIKRVLPHNRFPREDLDVWRGVDALCFAVRRRALFLWKTETKWRIEG